LSQQLDRAAYLAGAERFQRMTNGDDGHATPSSSPLRRCAWPVRAGALRRRARARVGRPTTRPGTRWAAGNTRTPRTLRPWAPIATSALPGGRRAHRKTRPRGRRRLRVAGALQRNAERRLGRPARPTRPHIAQPSTRAGFALYATRRRP